MLKSKISNIPSGYNFVHSLVSTILDQTDGDPLALSKIQIFLPNRRSCRTVEEVFLNAVDGKPLLLPRLIPVGDLDSDDILITSDSHHLLPPLPEHHRQFLLAELIMARGDMSQLNFGQALYLAQDLAQFIDFVHTHHLSYDDLPDLVDADLAKHWQITLDFLKIISEHWPKILAEQGFSDKADYRNRVIKAKISQMPHETDTLIAAGITGAMPIIRDFLHAIYQHKNGHVVLPGLDNDLEFETWQKILSIPHHPQHVIATLLAHLKIKRDNVQSWPETLVKSHHLQTTSQTMVHRAKLSSELHRPAETTALWNSFSLEKHADALTGLYEIDCENDSEEARVIAVIFRFIADHPDKTAMLVTPDRTLARHVSHILKRWNLVVDDSAGQPLSQTPVGRYLLLTAETALKQDNSHGVLALLKSSFTCLQYSRSAIKNLTARLENAIIRGPEIPNGWDNLTKAIEQSLSLKDEEERQALTCLIKKLQDSTAPLFDSNQQSFQDWMAAHIECLETLATNDKQDGADLLWMKEDGATAADLLGTILGETPTTKDLNGEDYLEGLRTALDTAMVQPRYRLHPRLQILSPTEARLQTADIVILGSLNEGLWPCVTDRNPWMSRSMRENFGMPGIEDMIGLSAHDFTQLLCSPCVYLTRAKIVDGATTVPSRWLQRLKTCLQQKTDHVIQPSNHPFKEWAQKMDDVPTDDITPQERPQPRPPVDKRPKRISATALEKYICDPYQIYAQKILALYKLPDIAEPFDRRAWGETVHKVLEVFTKEYRAIEKGQERQRLQEIAHHTLNAQFIPDSRRGYWQKRLDAICAYIIETILPDIEESTETYAEHQGQINIENVIVHGIADRIDVMHDQSVIITDYKTGVLPSKKSVDSGLSVQLPVLGLIAKEQNIGTPKALKYQSLKGKSSGQEEQHVFDADAYLDKITVQLKELFTLFADEKQPYWSRPHPDYNSRFDDYSHLARIKEWSASTDGGDGSKS